jgi:hypothetical protein
MRKVRYMWMKVEEGKTKERERYKTVVLLKKDLAYY